MSYSYHCERSTCFFATLFNFPLVYAVRDVHENFLCFSTNGTSQLSVYAVDINLQTHLLTYLLTPYYKVLLEKRTGSQPVKKFPAFYGTRMFITAFTSVRQLSLSWTSSIQSIPPHLTSWRSILILFSHLSLGLPSGVFPSGFPHQNPVYATPLTRTRYMTSPTHSSQFRWFYLPKYTCRK